MCKIGSECAPIGPTIREQIRPRPSHHERASGFIPIVYNENDSGESGSAFICRTSLAGKWELTNGNGISDQLWFSQANINLEIRTSDQCFLALVLEFLIPNKVISAATEKNYVIYPKHKQHMGGGAEIRPGTEEKAVTPRF